MPQTILVKQICEMFAGESSPTGFNKTKEVIDKSIDQVFSFDYPIFDEEYRPVLNKKILKHFYMREIGQETIALWQHYLDVTLNEVMPYYNKLYKSELLSFNPLYDVDLTTEYTKDFEGKKDGEDQADRTDQFTRDLKSSISSNRSDTSTGSSTSSTDIDNSSSGTATSESQNQTNRDDWDLFLDTPQGALDGMFGFNNTNTGKYLDNARHKYGNEDSDTTSSSTNQTSTNQTEDVSTSTNVSETGSTTGSGTETGTTSNVTEDNRTSKERVDNLEEYSERVFGKRGGQSYAKMMLEYRQTMLNIDKMILNDLEPLFYGLW